MRAWTLELDLGVGATFADTREHHKDGYQEGYHDAGAYACSYASLGCG